MDWMKKQDLPRNIVIEGLIGAGKTTATNRLSEFLSSNYSLNYRPMTEPILNGRLGRLLQAFYRDPQQYAFQLQVDVLTQRAALEREALYGIASHSLDGAIFDRSLAGDTCFAESQWKIGNMTRGQYDTYLKLYDLVKRGAMFPDLLVYLDVDIQVLVERIQVRARQYEQEGVSQEYLEVLNESYQEFLKAMSRHTTVLRIDWNDFRTSEYLWESICKAMANSENNRFSKTLRM